MALHFGKEGQQKEKYKPVGTLRRSQLLTTYGSGAIANMPGYSVIMASTDRWSTYSPTIHEHNLERLLGVTHFKEPYVSENPYGGPAADIPAFQFPLMHFCPSCGKLMPYWSFGDTENRKCKNCDQFLIPSRFLAGCPNGHLEDFPYNWWVHHGDFSQCPAVNKDSSLKISVSDESGGLEGIVVTCTACGQSRSMTGCLGKDALKGYHCRGCRPWIGVKREDYDPDPCNAPMWGLQKGASNVYFPQTISALTIPPWSSQMSLAVAEHWDKISSKLDTQHDPEHFAGYIDGLFSDLLQSGKYTVEDILDAIEQYRTNSSPKGYTKQKLYEDEYRMFCTGNYESADDYQFRIEQAGVPEFLQDTIDDVVKVKRLREVFVLMGFRRIFPEEPISDQEQGGSVVHDFMPLSRYRQKWYPGIEMQGEGIFIRLREERLQAWEEENREYYEPMKQRLDEANLPCENFSPRYVLLHTLAHLLIRQLSIACGYAGASIKERIYSTYPQSDQKMAGILLYTSSTDSDGSLGGLARNARPENFENIFRDMLESASWCSSDPICISSKAQGYMSLNYAACHACTLLPETSCEMRNCLLDRGAVTGSLLERGRGFFGYLLES